MIRALIADDEALARDTIRLLLKERQDVELIAECENGATTLEKIRALKPDLVFLDIQMPELDGFGVLESLHNTELPLIIFVTAYDQYAIRAFEYHALDYLLKPYDDDRFHKAVDRALAYNKAQEAAQLSDRIRALLGERQLENIAEPRPSYTERFAVRSRGGLIFVPTQDIDWIEAAGDYVTLHTGHQRHLLRETMENMLAQLDPSRFVRAHRSSILSLDKVVAIHPHFNGAYMATLSNQQRITISRRFWPQVEAKLRGDGCRL